MKIKIKKSTIKRKRKCGFRKRMQSPGGRRTLSRRRQRGRKKLTPV